MIIKRPSLIIPLSYQHIETKNYVYLIFCAIENEPVELSYTKNLSGIETNLDRAKQLALDIALDNYRNNSMKSQNIIVRQEPGNLSSPIWKSNIKKGVIIGGSIADQKGVRFIHPNNIEFEKNYKKRDSCIIT